MMKSGFPFMSIYSPKSQVKSMDLEIIGSIKTMLQGTLLQEIDTPDINSTPKLAWSFFPWNFSIQEISEIFYSTTFDNFNFQEIKGIKNLMKISN